MTAILILICLITVVIVAYIILFSVQIKHIRDQIEYVSQSEVQLFKEIQKIWDIGINSLNTKINEKNTEINEKIEKLEFNNRFKPIPIVKQETRPIKRLERAYYFDPNLNLELISPENFKDKVAGEICNELKNYIVFEQTVTEGRKALIGSIDIVIGGKQ